MEKADQTLLSELAIFEDSFSLGAAQTIAGMESLDAVDVVKGLASLTDNSLIQPYESDGESRFKMLQTIRSFSLKQLSDRGQLDLIKRRFTSYYLNLAEGASLSAIYYLT